MAKDDSPKAVKPTPAKPAEKDAAALEPWTLAWIQAMEKQRAAALQTQR